MIIRRLPGTYMCFESVHRQFWKTGNLLINLQNSDWQLSQITDWDFACVLFVFVLVVVVADVWCSTVGYVSIVQ